MSQVRPEFWQAAEMDDDGLAPSHLSEAQKAALGLPQQPHTLTAGVLSFARETTRRPSGKTATPLT